MDLQHSHSSNKDTAALVSVLVRSMNQAELRMALESIGQQTYPNIEIILVDAGGKGLDDYSDLALRHPVREVSDGVARNRPAAANAALERADGEFLLFLDEDDWIAPQHISKLVEQLSGNPGAIAAYSSTQLVTAEGEPQGQPLRIEFNQARLQRDNFIPIHACLFRRAAVASGCRFDESLDIFEDWDFWLQLSRHGSFFHVDELSAFYRQGGGSATASQPPATRYQPGHPIAEARARVFQKWLGVWSGSDINQMLGSVEQPAVVERLHGEVQELAREAQRLHQQMHKSNQLLNRKDAELQDARTHIARLSNDIQLFYQSFSWRLTRPVRALKRVLVGLGASEIKQRLMKARGSADQASEHEHIFFNLDPQPDHGEHPEILTIVGWSCSVAGIDRIEALVDGEPRMSFGTGINRPDVAKVHPECVDSLTAGFFQEIPLQDLNVGKHVLELRIFDKAGHSASIQHTFLLRKSSEIYNSWYWNNTPISSTTSPASESTAPVFHLVVLDNGNDKALQTTIGSIREQFRNNWRIILVSATAEPGSSAASVPPSQLTVRPDLESAINYLQGTTGWSVFLTGGETLAPHAVEEWSIASSGDARLLYSDHDLRSPNENHLAPCFTPQWAPDHLLSSNYVGGVYAIHNTQLHLLADINPGSPAWRYALLLEVIPAQLPVQRIAKVLWSAPEGSVPPAEAEKDMVQAWLQRVHPQASVSERNGIRHVAWPLDESLKVSIIIPTMGKLELLRPCLESVMQKTAYRNFELIMLDNSRGRFPEGIAYLKDQGLTVIECNEPFNWARLNNIGVRHASGDLYLFLNDDIEVTDEQWLGELVRQASRPDVGTVGALLYYPNGALQHAGVVLVDHGGGCTHLLYKRMPSDTIYRRLHETTREVSANTGACLMLAKARFEEAGGFDEELAVVGNDIDLCLRLLGKGYRNVWTPHCQLVHHESISRKTNSPRADEKTMWERWGKLFLAGDSYYNPNLSLTRADFSLPGGTQSAAQIHHPAAPGRFSAGVNLIGYTRAEMGVGEGARGDAKALTAVQEPFGIICFQSGNPSRMSDLSWQHKETESAPYDVTLMHINPDQAYRAISELPASHFDGHYRIGYWAWELPRIPEEWKRAFAYFDEIWAPSRFVQEAVAMSSPIPVVRIPHAVEVTADPSLTRKDFGLPDDAFLFLSMYDTYSLPERKNPLGALRAFCQAFEPDDMSVRMVMKINNSTPEGIRSLRNVIGTHANVILLDTVYSRPQVNALLASCNCFVSLHRSEGFGLGPAEAMALGKPVVATNWSGNVDYMRAGNSMPVDYRLITLQEDHGPYLRGQVWADPDIDHAARSMRELVANPQLAKALGTKARTTIEEEFSPLAVGRMMRQRLTAIREHQSH